MVVGQPGPSAPSKVVVQQPRRARDYLIFTLINMVVCFFFGGLPGALLTVPALICSLQVCQNCILSIRIHTVLNMTSYKQHCIIQ